ncbi:hypothetical protein BDV12DRAFT_200672 [Aspergillus spectabilis]
MAVRELTRLLQNYRKFNEVDLVAVLQALAIYMIIILFPTADGTSIPIVHMAILANIQSLVNYVAWTARPSVHWIVPLIRVAINQSGSYVILNVLFTYLPNTYQKYTASLFAANNATRSTLAAAAVVFGWPMFLAMGVAGGVSFLAGVSCLCTVAIMAFIPMGQV